MNEKEIQSFSLETLLTVNEPRPEDLYFDVRGRTKTPKGRKEMKRL